MSLAAEELLAGATVTYEVTLPAEVLHPDDGAGPRNGPSSIRLRPLTVSDLQLISRAASDGNSLLATLMVQRALVEPEMTVAQVSMLHVGLVQFVLGEVNRISGITATEDHMTSVSEAPIARAAFILAEEFGWTPEQVGTLTLGQVLLHLEMLSRRDKR
jgi:hypothetical protein